MSEQITLGKGTISMDKAKLADVDKNQFTKRSPIRRVRITLENGWMIQFRQYRVDRFYRRRFRRMAGK